MSTPPIYLTNTEIAARYRVCTNTVRKWFRGIRIGGATVRLCGTVIGVRTRATAEQVEDFIERCRLARFGDATEPTVSPAKVAKRFSREKHLAAAACRAEGGTR